MQKTMAQMRDHVIVCGCGTTGSRVVAELWDTRTPFVVIDTDEEKLLRVRDTLPSADLVFCYVVGDATQDAVLAEAGLERAKSLVASLRDDRDNLFLVLSARQSNAALRIVARATEPEVPDKLRLAGADKVVTPNILGGMRIASEVIRPDVTDFLDTMLRDKVHRHRIEQVRIPPDSPFVGHMIQQAGLRQVANILVMAVRRKDGEFVYNPGGDIRLEEEDILVVLGAVDDVARLRAQAGKATLTSWMPKNMW